MRRQVKKRNNHSIAPTTAPPKVPSGGLDTTTRGFSSSESLVPITGKGGTTTEKDTGPK